MPFLAKEGGQVAPHAAVVRAELVRVIQLGVALAELRAAVDPIVADVSDARAAGEAADP